MNTQPIAPITRPFRKNILVPGSKSITNRALPLAAMARGGPNAGASTLTGVLFADDTLQMINALTTLGYPLHVDRPNKTITLTGQGRTIPHPRAELHCGNSGTTIRFLTAMLAAGVPPEGQTADYTLDGIARMRQRPIAQLVDQLRALGAKIDYPLQDGFPPIRIHSTSTLGDNSGLAGGGCQFTDAKSSQYISAILMAAPLARNDVTVQLLGPITSEPYISMTLRMMQQFGVSATVHDQCVPASHAASRILSIPGNRTYTARDYAIEPDASNASYFLAAAALFKDASVTIEGLGKNSLQGDVAFADLLHQMGASLLFGPDFITITGTGQLHGITVDMNHIPDMVQTLAVVALFADSPTTVTNVYNLRIKETDRLAALENELTKLGAQVATTRDSITLVPPKKPAPAAIATYDDHRMAMAFAIAGLKIPGIVIQDPECTAKTYPEYFTDLQQLYT